MDLETVWDRVRERLRIKEIPETGQPHGGLRGDLGEERGAIREVEGCRRPTFFSLVSLLSLCIPSLSPILVREAPLRLLGRYFCRPALLTTPLKRHGTDSSIMLVLGSAHNKGLEGILPLFPACIPYFAGMNLTAFVISDHRHHERFLYSAIHCGVVR